MRVRVRWAVEKAKLSPLLGALRRRRAPRRVFIRVHGQQRLHGVRIPRPSRRVERGRERRADETRAEGAVVVPGPRKREVTRASTGGTDSDAGP